MTLKGLTRIFYFGLYYSSATSDYEEAKCFLPAARKITVKPPYKPKICLSVDMLSCIMKVIEFEGKVCFKSP